jgi:hypothetical protein
MGKSAIQTIDQSFVHFLYLQKSFIAIWLQFINVCMILWWEYIETKHLMYVKISLFENKTLNITIHHESVKEHKKFFLFFIFFFAFGIEICGVDTFINVIIWWWDEIISIFVTLNKVKSNINGSSSSRYLESLSLLKLIGVKHLFGNW